MKTSLSRLAVLTTALAASAVDVAAQEAASATPPGVLDFLLAPHYLLFLLISTAGLVLVFKRWTNRMVRIGALAVVFVLFGLDYFFPLHPSPMCGVTKLFMFKITNGVFYPVFIAIFLAIFIPSLIGRKLFCGLGLPARSVSGTDQQDPVQV